MFTEIFHSYEDLFWFILSMEIGYNLYNNLICEELTASEIGQELGGN